MRAYIALREAPHYRRDAFVRGLRALGFDARPGVTNAPASGDVLVTWNRYGAAHASATEFERRGCAVLVVENGYLGNTFAGAGWYAISRSHHNGRGTWPNNGPERWDELRVPLAPWRARGDEIVVLPQRGIGPPGVAMPAHWTETAVAYLRARTNRPIRVRPHPGKHDVGDLVQNLGRAWCAVTWASGAGIKAIVAGVPVFYGMDEWIGAPAAASLRDADIERPRCDDGARLAMLRRLAWAQWRLPEIESGAAMRALLGMK